MTFYLLTHQGQEKIQMKNQKWGATLADADSFYFNIIIL
jgi:hypothetical protein